MTPEVAQLRAIGAELDQTPTIYQRTGQVPYRRPPAPPVPPPRGEREEALPFGPPVAAETAALLGVPTLSLTRLQEFLATQLERVTERLRVLTELSARIARVREEAAALNDASHQAKEDIDAFLADVGRVLTTAAPAPPADAAAAERVSAQNREGDS